MRFAIAAVIEGCPDAIIRFLPPHGPVSFSDPELQQSYRSIYQGDVVELEHQQLRMVRLPFRGGFSTLFLMGFDSAVPTPFDDFRSAVASLGTALNQQKSKTVLLDRLDGVTFASEEELLGQVACTLPLSEYKFDTYLTEKKPTYDRSVTVLADPSGQSALEEGACLAESVCTARDLVNELADVLTPEELARRCRELGQTYGFHVEVLDRNACEEAGMGLFLAVAKGSSLEPRLITMQWAGGPAGDPPIALVGKGITYDSGGLAIKTSSMESMRFDMNGAAAVVGAMCAIARQKLPRNVVAAVAACENMVDANSYRNGDVLRSMSGQTVFVRNTDAEGRLTMADAMTYCIRKFHPSQLLEVAGLTGSVCNFFGSICAAALATDQALFDRIAALSPITGEKYAQMPYFPEYRKLLKSPYADLNNAPAGGAGGILAGFFLEAFREGTPFLHVDFGAMPFTSKPSDGQPEGGTGFGVKTLYQYVKHYCPIQ